MTHFFEQITRTIEEAEWVSILITILIIVILLSFIVVNIISCICQISMKKTLKKIADQKQCSSQKPKRETQKD